MNVVYFFVVVCYNMLNRMYGSCSIKSEFTRITMNFELLPLEQADTGIFKHDIQEAFQKGYEDGMRLKKSTLIQRFGKPVLRILKREISISTLINADLR